MPYSTNTYALLRLGPCLGRSQNHICSSAPFDTGPKEARFFVVSNQSEMFDLSWKCKLCNHKIYVGTIRWLYPPPGCQW